MMSSAEEMELVEQALAGDRLALDRLLCRQASSLKKHIEPKFPDILKGVVDVEDILQQTFLQVSRDIHRFQPQGQGSFSAWIRGIAENRLLDCVREHKRKKRGGDFHRAPARPADSSTPDAVSLLTAAVGTPSQSVARHELIDAIHHQLSKLPEDQREAIRLHCLEGRSLDETAEALQRTPGAIRALVHRGKQKLQHEIDRSTL